ncbi:HAD-IIB family hydrolase [Bifidobacterium saguinibicoloris]|uniref:HAD-IIB family hydrolase n=1 Tax=Bifidobacterium saguinibicoloris TaxID=2834433 RepID=UPI001C58BE3B|nr:HAD-IIB family hydrolase [Bifidobacterium saguinibicoloris]MBW3080352.1 HAD-IIB family hydrolase [Bifidobacterium saguinibicoloris]
MIRAWNDWDMDVLCRRARLIGFDLDNTLANSKRPMLPEMAARFSELTRRIDVAVVTGGRYELVISQILDVLDPDADLGRLHLMPTSGTCYRRWDGEEWRTVFVHDLTDDQRVRARASLERRAREQGLWFERVWGERIEDRGSQITFSVLGQQAPLEEKCRFDPSGVLKAALAEAVAGDLPDLKVHAGGYTSVDVAGKGIDKAYALRELSACTGVDVGDIVFVGDRMRPGGNDYPAAQAGAMGVEVTCPADTLRFIDGLLARLPRIPRSVRAARTAAHDGDGA